MTPLLDLLLLATMLLVCGGIGLPLARVLPSSFMWRLAIAPVLGYSVLAVAAPVAYRAGVTIPAFFVGSLVVAVASLALHARWLVRAARASEPDEGRLTLAFIGVCGAASIVLLAPRWVGGEAFSVFQGNHWDTFGYVESALVYAREPYSVVKAATDHEIMRNPLLPLAIGQLDSRVSVHQLYAVFSRIAPGQAYRLYYPFLAFSLLQFFQVATFVLRNAFPAMSPRALFAVALVFPLGFWGQYVFDINAWSQLAATPALFLTFGLLLAAATRVDADLRSGLRLAAVLGIAVAGAIFVYPEGFLIYMAALVPVTTATIAYGMIRAHRIRLLNLVPLLGLFAAAAIVLYGPVYDFMLAQLSWRSGGVKVPWWDFFDGFYFGRDRLVGHQPATSVELVAGFFGLYFATPLKSAGKVISALRHISIIVVVLGLLVGLGAQLLSSSADTRKRLAFWGFSSLLLLAPAAWFAMDANYWPAGKAVSYAAPVFITLLCIPLGLSFGTGALRRVRWIVGAFVVFQLANGVTRIGVAHRPQGIHYALPYPSVQGYDLKRDYPWNLRPLESVLAHDTHVLIHPMAPWPLSYLTMFLYSRGIPFAIDGPINTYFGKGKNLPGLPRPWNPDVEITFEAAALVVRFNDGRPPLRLGVE